MVRHVIYTRLRPGTLFTRLAELPRILAGDVADKHGIRHGFRMRLASAFFEKVKLAFITKSRGGTDEAGIKWKPLSKEYLAYGRVGVTGNKNRRFKRGEQHALKKGEGLGRGHKYAPGGQTGLLTKAQLSI